MSQNFCALKWLSLSNNHVGPAGAKRLASALVVNYTLEELRMGSNAIGPEGFGAIGSSLQQKSTLTGLYVRSNGIGDEGVQAFAECALRGFRCLGLQQNEISNHGCQCLDTRISAGLSNITTIELDRNHVEDIGITSLADAVQRSPLFACLTISDNWIGENGAQALAGIVANVSFGICALRQRLLSPTGCTLPATMLLVAAWRWCAPTAMHRIK